MKKYFSITTPKGMSLVEVMVAILILGIAMEGFTLLYLKSWQTNSFVLEEGLASASASRTVNQVVSDLRKVRQADNGDYPIEWADDFDLTVYMDIDTDGVTERVHYFLDTEELRRGVTEPAGSSPVTYPAGDQTVTILAQYVVNTGSEPIFYYYNRDYPGDTTANPLSTPIAVAEARLIKVHLRVNIDPVKAPNNINIESFAELRNLNDN